MEGVSVLATRDPEVQAALGLLEAQLEGERSVRQIPGLSAAVVHEQELVWSRGFGHARREDGAPAEPTTIYRVGSITKLFTATMLMQLRDAGKLHLDEPLEAYLPAMRLKSQFRDATPATFRQVVSHTGGLPREAPFDHWKTLAFPSLDDLLAGLSTSEMIFPPLTEFKYSNLGIAVMGHILERIAGQPYTEYIAERILPPLGMRNSAFDLTDNLQARMPTGYLPAGDGNPPQPSPHPHLNGFTPAGQLYSTVEDMARFMMLQFAEGATNGAQVLAAATIREMRQPVMMMSDWQAGTAIGWRLARTAGRVTISHGGGVHGFTTQIMLVPDLKLGVAVFTNTGTDPQSISRAALELLIPIFARVRARQEATTSVRAPAEWQQYVGRYSMAGIVEVDVQIVGGKLVAVEPKAPVGAEATLTPAGAHSFRASGGAVTGELAAFELNEAGQVTGLRYGAYPLDRV